jgi:hypothetical protein
VISRQTFAFDGRIYGITYGRIETLNEEGAASRRVFADLQTPSAP